MENEKKCQMLTPGKGKPCKYYTRPKEKSNIGTCQQPGRFLCEEALKRKLPPLSYSSLTDYIQCRIKYFYRKLMNIELKPQHLPEAMKFGKLWDVFIQSRYEDGCDYPQVMSQLQLTPEQTARISALMKAFNDLEVAVNKDSLLSCQYKISWPLGIMKANVVGVVDRAYEDYFIETKTSSNPTFYMQKENIFYQVGTYFLADKSWDHVVMEVVRMPRAGRGEEDPEKLEQRIYSDILSRPSYYFPGWDRESKTFGTKFYRSEFDLHEVYQTFSLVYEELKHSCIHNVWWPNKLACHVPTPCVYLPIEKAGGHVSEELYDRGNPAIIMWKGDDKE